jgi:hypothetical protein
VADLDALGRALVEVGLAVGDDDDALTVQVAVEGLFQAARGPLAGEVVALVRHALHQFADVLQDGLEFASSAASAAAEEFAQFGVPAVARPTGGKQREQEREQGEQAEGGEEETARLLFAVLNVAEVVQQDEEAQLPGFVCDGHDADMDTAGGKVGNGAPGAQFAVDGGSHAGADGPAVEVFGKAGSGCAGREVEAAGGASHHAFVAGKLGELALQVRRIVPGAGQCRTRARKDEPGAVAGIAFEPLAGGGFHHARGGPREDRQADDERQHQLCHARDTSGLHPFSMNYC